MIDLPKIINKAEMARAIGLLPQNFNDKLKGKNRRKFTEDDKTKVLEAMEQAIQEVQSIEVK